MAYLEGKCTTGGTPTPNVRVYAFRSGQWGAPASGVSDANGDWRVDGLQDDTLHDVAFVHPDGQWEGKMSSRRMPIFDPFADPYWQDTVMLCNFDDVSGQIAINERGIDGFGFYGGANISISDSDPTPNFGTGALRMTGAQAMYCWSTNGIAATGTPVYLSGTDDFTVEGWVWIRSGIGIGNYRDIVIVGSPDKGLVINSSNQLVWYDGGIKLQGPTMNASWYDRWIWVVAQKKSASIKLWLDGDAIGAFADSQEKNSFRLGSNTSGAEQMFGAFDSWRFTRAARYDPALNALPVPSSPYGPGNPIRSDDFSNNRIWLYSTNVSVGTWNTAAARLNCTWNGSGQAIAVRRDFKAKNFFLEADFFKAVDAGFVWRYVDANNFYQMTLSDSAAATNAKPNVLRVYKWVGGTPSQVGSDMPVTVTRDTANIVRVEMVGDDMTFKINNAVIGTVTDTSLSTITGSVGFRCSPGSGYDGLIQVDNFKWDTLL